MSVREEVLPFIGMAILATVLIALMCRVAGADWRSSLLRAGVPGAILIAYFAYFFRDPERAPPRDAGAIVAGADGHIASIVRLSQADFLGVSRRAGVEPARLGRLAAAPEVTRISIFLSLFNVHVNRSPIAGQSTFLGYFPGKHYFTFGEKSSDENQHNAILVEGSRTACLVNQIVGPVCRRVVYWPDPNRAVELRAGDRIGMMKFGSRLDMYFPSSDIKLLVEHGQRVSAGVTVVARLAGGEAER